MISVRCFDSLAAAAPLREDVNALNRRSVRPDPFSTFEFFENFFRHDEFVSAGSGQPLWFLMAFRAGHLIGYLALREVSHKVMGLATRALGFLVTHDTDRPHVVARAEDLEHVTAAFCDYLIGRRREWSFLELQQQDGTSSLFPPPPAVERAGYLVREWPSLENCTIHIRWDTLHDYFKALSKRFRSNVSRQARALFGAGNVELLASADPVTNAAMFELYRCIEPHSWKAQANANIGRHPRRVEYFAGLLSARQPMRVSIQVLMLDGVPIAGLISGAFMGGLYALHIVYDDRVSRLGPGSTMLLLGMRQAINGRYAFFNLLSGFRYYKIRWLAEATETRIAQIYRAGSLAFWRRRFGDWKRRVLAAQSNPVSLLFNPARREIDETVELVEPLAPGAVPQLAVTHAERERITALVNAVRNGQGESLSAAQLAAVMPFETGRS